MTTTFLNPPSYASSNHTVTLVPAQTPFVVRDDVEIKGGFACLSFTHAGQRQIVEFLLPHDCLCAGDEEEDPRFRLFALSTVELIPLTAERAPMEQRARRARRALSMARQGLINVGTRQALPRCAHLFCELFTRAQAAGLSRDLSCPLPIRQSDIADALGLTPVHVNRTLRLLREKELVTWRRGVLRIHDFVKLQRCCGFNPSYLGLAAEGATSNDDLIPLRPAKEAPHAAFVPGSARPILSLRPNGDSDGAPRRQ